MYILLGICLVLFVGLWVAVLRAKARSKRLYIRDGITDIQTPQSIQKVLNLAAKGKVPLSIRLGDSENTYTSYLLRIGEEKKERFVYMDALVPEEGNDLISEAGTVHVSFVLREDPYSQRNIPYEFSTQFLKQTRSGGFRELVFKFPEGLLRKQRREYLRVRPPEREPIYIKFNVGEVEHRFKIWDISGGGVAFVTDLNDEILPVGAELKDAMIEINGTPAVRCIAVIHKKTALGGYIAGAGKKGAFICGAMFKEIEEEDRQLIIKYVVAVEREELRRLRASPMAIDFE